MSDLRTILERGVGGATPPPDGFERMLHRHDRKRRNQRIAAGVVGIAVFVAVVWIVRDVALLDRSETPAVPGPAVTGPAVTGPEETGPTVTGPTFDFSGLPPEGAEPSTPEQGELVAGVDQLHVGGAYVYADGRVISWGRTSEAARTSSMGPYRYREQRLTPEGVQLLLSGFLSTGLFDRDLKVDTGSLFTPNPLFAFVRDGGRFVRVSHDDDAAPPTPEQASALELVDLLVTDPRSLVPASAWADPTMRPYVPYRYAICTGLYGLPAAAADLLRGKERTFDGVAWWEPPGLDCYDVTTEEARALDEILTHAGFIGARAGLRTSGATYELESPERSADLEPLALVSFYPVFPHGAIAIYRLG